MADVKSEALKCERLSPGPVKDEQAVGKREAMRHFWLPADGFAHLPVDPPGRLGGGVICNTDNYMHIYESNKL